VGLVEVRASWPGHPREKKKKGALLGKNKKKISKTKLLKFVEAVSSPTPYL
jgi:hypothetical protein